MYESGILSPFRIASECVGENEETGIQHLLLFVSALIPKAFASIMTSVVIELSKPENVSIEYTFSNILRGMGL